MRDRTINLRFSALGDGSFVPLPMEDPAVPSGWHPRLSDAESTAQRISPVISPAWERTRALPPAATASMVASSHLALPAAMLALRAAKMEVLDVLASEHLHGFCVRASFSLLLSVRAEGEPSPCVVAVAFTAHASIRGINMDKVGDVDDTMPSLVFTAMVNVAALVHVQKVLVLYHSDQARVLHWHLSPVPNALRRLRQRLAATWFPEDGLDRLAHFNEMAKRELGQEPPIPISVQLPKDVCGNLWCPAGQDCSKHRHLFQITRLPACGCTRAQCIAQRTRAGSSRCVRQCPLHHCLTDRLPAGRLTLCTECATPWVPSEEDPLWLRQDPQPQASKRKAKKVPSREEAAGAAEAEAGWPALQQCVFALKVSEQR